MSTNNIKWTDKQWFAFICGVRDGLNGVVKCRNRENTKKDINDLNSEDCFHLGALIASGPKSLVG